MVFRKSRLLRLTVAFALTSPAHGFKSHINSIQWDSAPTTATSSTQELSSSVERKDETAPISPTVRRWNEVYNVTSDEAIQELLSESEAISETEEERLLIVHESELGLDNNHPSFYEFDQQMVVMGQEDVEAPPQSEKQPWMIPTFASPNAYHFQYKRYHPTMAPPSQLFHTVTMGGVVPNHSNARTLRATGSGRYTAASSKASLGAVPIHHQAMEGGGLVVDDSSTTKTQPMWHYWRPLLKMCRLQNLPGVLIFHSVAVHLMHRVAGTSAPGPLPSLLALLLQPGMVATLLATMLITCISMLFNDYYDTKSGVDLVNEMSKFSDRKAPYRIPERGSMTTAEYYSSAMLSPTSETVASDKPLVTGELPRRTARSFITLMAVATLSTTMFLPGVLPKLAVLVSGIIVYFYTESLKPITWVKNISCAGLIAASPLVSGVAAWQLMSRPAASAALPAFQTLSRLMACIFSWSMSREIVMDISDYKGDKFVGVSTIPVRHGKRFASKVALTFASLFAMSTTLAPLLEVVNGTPSSVHVLPSLVRFLLAAGASIWIVGRTYQVCRDEGEHDALSQQMVDDSMITALMAIGSFI